jgi:FtsP/CotA-like multicopper oxidase with cupredoxin domain
MPRGAVRPARAQPPASRHKEFGMTFTRRDLLKTAGASLTMIALPPAHAASTPMKLRASAFMQPVRPGVSTNVWGFNGSVPGPVLRLRKGDLARVAVTNNLPASNGTTVHWHGLRVPNAMDGVPQVTQDPIAVGDTFEYKFPAVDSGTFWYHPHQSSFEQVARGMYGTLIVDEDKPVPVDRDVIWVLSDFKLGSDGHQVEDFGRIQAFGGGGRLGNVFALNGKEAGRTRKLDVRSGERIRLRLLNTASARVFLLEFRGQNPMVVAYDGQGVEPHPVPQGLLMLGPGMRVDLILDCIGSPGESFAVIDRRDQGHQIATIAYARQAAVRRKPLGDSIRIEPNVLPEPDLSKASQHFILFEGGLLGKPAIGLVDGKPAQVAEIMQKHGLFWTMNYMAEQEHAMMHTPLFNFRLGEHVALKMVNETEFEHPMHLHGHFFRVLRINDRPAPLREWRDTVMVSPRGSVDIAFVADNPGEWMFHCHILEHAAGGMMGTVTVD